MDLFLLAVKQIGMYREWGSSAGLVRLRTAAVLLHQPVAAIIRQSSQEKLLRDKGRPSQLSRCRNWIECKVGMRQWLWHAAVLRCDAADEHAAAACHLKIAEPAAAPDAICRSWDCARLLLDPLEGLGRLRCEPSL